MSEFDPWLSLDETMALTQLPRSTIYSRMSRGTFPQRQKPLGGMSRSVAWRQSAIVAYMAKPQPARRAARKVVAR